MTDKAEDVPNDIEVAYADFVKALPDIERNFDAFCDALDEVCERYKDAEAITFAEAVGALEFIKAKILRQAFDETNE